MGILQSAPDIFVPFQCGVSQAPRMQNGANQADSMVLQVELSTMS
jgi:hypothetical protein